ncbi:hypothetical protein [Mycobacterium paraterrae]|uniref:Polysaccharide biosynthesis protein C-terminal domain-containing protein n=1 Tax=Mycobacterium paraterrae TaxID=577492 RepID=A0ABY3VVU5_9MYCO|nr:hypothetical protein [Mycobacterium paraterrae]UMB70715.1 hypothetical protein MKK62_05250 [Mycobacterium paraterrae]
MPAALSISKVRAISGAADQVFSSLSNGLIVYAVAVVTVSQRFGQIALLLTLLAAAIGVLRGALGTPLLLTAGSDPSEIRREGSFALTSALLVSPVVAAAMWAVAGPGIRTPALAIIVATPIVLAEDVLRYVAIAEGRPQVAAMWDGVWFTGSAALLGATWLHSSLATTTYLLAGWAALASVAAVGMIMAVRIQPRARRYQAWIRGGWQHRVRYGIDSGLEQTTVFAVLLFAAVVLDPAVSAALRGATALLAPVAIAVGALPLAVIPESRRHNMAPPQVWKSLARISLVTSSGSLLLGLALFFLPPAIGHLVLGRTFEATQPIIPIIAFEFALAAWSVAVTIFLRTFNRSADALQLKLCYVLAMLVLVPGSGLVFRSAEGVAAGIATAMTFYVALAILRVRPWVEPGVSKAPRAQLDSTQLSMSSVKALAIPGGVADPIPAPVPLTTRLRLHTATRTGGALVTLWVFVALAVFGPALIVTFTSNPPNSYWLWTLPATVLCAARFAWLIGSGQRRLFESMFWSFTYMFLCVAPLAQLRENEWPGTVPRMDNTYIAAAALMVIAGCGAFLAGAGLDTVTVLRGALPRTPGASAMADRTFSVNYPRTVILCVFAVVLNLYYLSNTGWLQFMHSRYEAQDIGALVFPSESAGVVLRACSYMALLVAFITLVRFRREARMALQDGEHISPKLMRGSLVLVWVIGLLLADNMNPISNARYQSGTAMLAAATAYGLFGTARRFRLTSMGFLAALLVIFPLADAFRVSQQAELKASNPIQSLLSDDYDSFAQLMNGYLIAARDGIVPGRQFVGVLLWWVPRDMWPNKPVDTGIFIANMRGYGFTNLSAPLWVEMFLNGGWLALVLGMFVLGFGLHRWDTGLNSQFEGYGMPGVLGCILPFYMLILLRGSLLQAASFLFFILAFGAFVRQRKPRARRIRGAKDDRLPVNTTRLRVRYAGA